MTYIKVEQAHTDDERWIEAGADAFAIHIAAIVYCDRQLLDGRISRAMAQRVSLAVPPERTADAIKQLVVAGFWEEGDDGYLINRYDEHAFPADQIQRTRDRWKADKDRRRQHNVGDHSLCKDPKFCPALAAASTVESGVEARGGGSHLNPTQPNQTRPDRRSGSGSGSLAPGVSASAAPLSLRPAAEGALKMYVEGTREHSWMTPWDVVVTMSEFEGHARCSFTPPDRLQLPHTLEEIDNGVEWFNALARIVIATVGGEAFVHLRETHKCDLDSTACAIRHDAQDGREHPEPWLDVHVPPAVVDAWYPHLHETWLRAHEALSPAPKETK